MSHTELVVAKIEQVSSSNAWTLNIQHFGPNESITKFLSIESLSFYEMRQIVLKIESSLNLKKSKTMLIHLKDYEISITNRENDYHFVALNNESNKIYDAILNRQVLIDIFMSSPLVLPQI